MKLILFLGTSISAVTLAIGFAVFADQAVNRQAAPVAERPLPVRPSRIAPQTDPVARIAARPLVQDRAQHQPEPQPAGLEPRISTAGHAPEQAGILPRHDKLDARPLPRPVALAAFAPLTDDRAPVDIGPIPAERFHNLPLIGVYR